ncbi:hypothetical protein LINPERHAP2_LOCUS10965, partial [Linum perenne]
WICVGEHDIIPSIEDGVRSLSISKSLKEKLCRPWTNTVVVRLLGKSIGYSYLCHRLRSLWKPAGNMQIIDLDKDCFLVKFGAEHDYYHALTGGPWLILEHYLIVQQLDPLFRASDKLPTKLVVWVRLPHLPIVFYHPQILTALGNLIGRTVRIDFQTQNVNRGKFARLAMEINVEEALAPVIVLDGTRQKVDYENIPMLCFDCGKVGHNLDFCPLKVGVAASEVEDAMGPENAIEVKKGKSVADERAGDEFGPWMVVARKHRRQWREVVPNKESGRSGKVTDGKDGSVKVSNKEIKEGGKVRIDGGSRDLGIKAAQISPTVTKANGHEVAILASTSSPFILKAGTSKVGLGQAEDKISVMGQGRKNGKTKVVAKASGKNGPSNTRKLKGAQKASVESQNGGTSGSGTEGTGGVSGKIPSSPFEGFSPIVQIQESESAYPTIPFKERIKKSGKVGMVKAKRGNPNLALKVTKSTSKHQKAASWPKEFEDRIKQSVLRVDPQVEDCRHETAVDCGMEDLATEDLSMEDLVADQVEGGVELSQELDLNQPNSE